MASGSGNERSRQKYYVSEVLSLLHLDDTQSGSDLDYDEFNNSATESDTENTNIVESMDTSDGNATDVPIVQKKRKLQTPGVTEDREWVDITDKKMTNYQMVPFRTSLRLEAQLRTQQKMHQLYIILNSIFEQILVPHYGICWLQKLINTTQGMS